MMALMKQITEVWRSATGGRLLIGRAVLHRVEEFTVRRPKRSRGLPASSASFVFKSSSTKRTALALLRGSSMDEGLRILPAVKELVGVPVLTDIHESYQADRSRESRRLKSPLLCRQTDLSRRCAHGDRSTSRRDSSPRRGYAPRRASSIFGDAQIF